MHPEARLFIARHASAKRITVIECGARNINGTVRDLFPKAKWVGVDITEGPGVDVVADFTKYKHDKPAAVVVCCEVLEHAEQWPKIIKAAADNLRKGGTLLLTAAGPGRAPHSAFDGGTLQPGEFYENIDPDKLASVLDKHFTKHDIDILGPDVRAVAVK